MTVKAKHPVEAFADLIREYADRAQDREPKTPADPLRTFGLKPFRIRRGKAPSATFSGNVTFAPGGVVTICYGDDEYRMVVDRTGRAARVDPRRWMRDCEFRRLECAARRRNRRAQRKANVSRNADVRAEGHAAASAAESPSKPNARRE
jgi:hypothetical protein